MGQQARSGKTAVGLDLSNVVSVATFHKQHTVGGGIPTDVLIALEQYREHRAVGLRYDGRQRIGL